VTVFGTGPGSTAVVTCEPGLYADNGDQEMTVRCRLNGQWSFPNPGCSSWSNSVVTFLKLDNVNDFGKVASNAICFLHIDTFYR